MGDAAVRPEVSGPAPRRLTTRLPPTRAVRAPENTARMASRVERFATAVAGGRVSYRRVVLAAFPYPKPLVLDLGHAVGRFCSGPRVVAAERADDDLLSSFLAGIPLARRTVCVQLHGEVLF